MYKDGAGAVYNATTAQFETVLFGEVASGTSRVANLVGGATKYYEPYNFTDATTFAQKADNSVAGEMRDCGECHVGGGAMEYMVDDSAATSGTYDANKRKSLRDYVFGGAVTAFNALIDIFNDTPANRGNVVVQDYSQTGVLEMDCLICHQNDYSWEKRKDAVRKGEFDASRAVGSKLAFSAKDGVNVFYNSTSVTATPAGLVANLEYKIVGKPTSNQCSSCHLGNTIETKDAITGVVTVTGGEKYQVDWKKRGEMWSQNGTILDVHGAIGCMGCHERTGATAGTTAQVGVSGNIGDNKLGLCDPAKGGASPFDAMWNKMDKVEFKDCSGCHEYATAPAFATFGAPNSKGAHDRAGLTAKIAYDKAGAQVSHIDLIDCTACHIRKDGFSGGAFVDGTGADEEGRLAVHDTEYVAKGNMNNGVALHWQNGKIYAANLLTSFFWRDMNGLKTINGGFDANNDGREAGMDPLLQTHVANINRINGLHALTADGVVNAAEIATQQAALSAGIRGQLGNTTTQATNAFLPKVSFLMVPFKASHNIASADRAWGKNGCQECHAANAGFYNGAYPINGNMDGKFSFDSNQVTTFTKVNGLVDITDSHPNVVTKDGTRSLPIPILTKFDGPYVQTATPGQTLRNIDRSEVLYENTFQTINQDWVTSIQGGAIAAACSAASPFYCEDPAYIFNAAKKGATSTLGWTLKVDVKDSNGVITSRTVQITDDKVTTVDQLVTLLDNAGKFGSTFFTVTAANGGVKLDAAAGYQIRINKLSDVGPFGLKGALWKTAPIVRGANSYATRAQYVTYLNSITASAFGVGATPVAGIAAVNGESGTTAAPLVKDLSYAIAATGTPAAGARFQWATNAGTAASITDATAASTSISFNKAGTYRVALTVTNVDGATATSYKLVNVTNPVLISVTGTATAPVVKTIAATATRPAYTYTVQETKVPVTVVAGTTYDKVRFFWGDGSSSTTLTAADFATANGAGGVAHVYNRYEKYFKSGTGKYTFKTTIQLFNGSTLVSSQSVIVEVP
ncbi:cytochrome c3 family protein [Geomonas ferrireducens]|uniref:PKD domain-containing protein n=1 Tax=Geomonas ferrireducens TaxID=2570227 RepID=UPI0010A7CD83|nr:PKD domain-containing protein [Geomonas ferrireducens]